MVDYIYIGRKSQNKVANIFRLRFLSFPSLITVTAHQPIYPAQFVPIPSAGRETAQQTGAFHPVICRRSTGFQSGVIGGTLFFHFKFHIGEYSKE
jgi:hypothetical protein